MPTFKLDGKEIEFEPGETIIRAAWRQGVEIPHYCWHPGLSIAANCRMCLVEVKAERQIRMPTLRWDEAKQEYVPDTKVKLVPACQTVAADGMEVYAANEEAKQAQGAVQEFLLLNHPVDCPICDQAGECKLQDYWLTSQGSLKRKHTEPVHKPKAVRFGPTIVYDAERCIMCTRCVRVCDEVVGDHVLDIRRHLRQLALQCHPALFHGVTVVVLRPYAQPAGQHDQRYFREGSGTEHLPAAQWHTDQFFAPSHHRFPVRQHLQCHGRIVPRVVRVHNRLHRRGHVTQPGLRSVARTAGGMPRAIAGRS
jgi:NADH-quinone oxidoreductase subunit G